MKEQRTLSRTPARISNLSLVSLFLIILAGSASVAANSGPRVKELIEGAPIKGASGIAFDDRDRLYVASALGREIVRMNPRNGLARRSS